MGNYNTATGVESLRNNLDGGGNTANGHRTLYSNTKGSNNTASGFQSLYFNTEGEYNTAIGAGSLYANTVGKSNTAIGAQSLGRSTGSNNVALGNNAGYNLTSGDNNVYITNTGGLSESNTIRIGTNHQRTFLAGVRGVTVTGGATVLIDANGQMGTISSSARYKHDIRDMGDLGARLMQLRPVTFRYNTQGQDAPIQFGLIAEEVNEVLPELVARNKDGEIETVMYHELPAMLLSEIQRQRRAIDSLESDRDALRTQRDALGRTLRELSARITALEESK